MQLLIYEYKKLKIKLVIKSCIQKTLQNVKNFSVKELFVKM